MSLHVVIGQGAPEIVGLKSEFDGARYEAIWHDGTSAVQLTQDGAVNASGSGTTIIRGVSTIDFGAFPGSSHAFIDVTGQTGFASSSQVIVSLAFGFTADHSADEHMLETLKIYTEFLAPGSFRIHGVNTSQINEPLAQNMLLRKGVATDPQTQGLQVPLAGGRGTRLYGGFGVHWGWFN